MEEIKCNNNKKLSNPQVVAEEKNETTKETNISASYKSNHAIALNVNSLSTQNSEGETARID